MTHVLGIDIGNSGLRIAELDVPQRRLGRMLRINWLAPGQPPHDRDGQRRYPPDRPEWTGLLGEFVQAAGGDPDGPTAWWISSVRRDAGAVLQQYLHDSGAMRVSMVDYHQLPLHVDVAAPQRVGIDRLLAALAASQLTETRPAVVIQAGSAVTVDLLLPPPLSRDGQLRQPRSWATFAGGAILPGIPMMLRLLGQGADLLPQLDAGELETLPPLPGKNTEQAMLCGTASALVGGVRHLVERYRQQFGAQVPVILSGGDGMRLVPFLSPPLMDVPHLVHLGLLQLAAAAEHSVEQIS